MAIRSASDAVTAPEGLSGSEALYEDAAATVRLRAEEFRAEDLDGILDGVSSTGNLNFAILQAGLTDASLDALDESTGFDSVGVDGSDLAARQGELGDVAQDFVGNLSSASSFGAANALSGGAIFVDAADSEKSFQSNSLTGSSFSAQFSAAPMGAAVNDLGVGQVAEAPTAAAAAPETNDGGEPSPLTPQQGGDVPPSAEGENPDGGGSPDTPDTGVPTPPDVLGDDGLLDDVLDIVEPVVDQVVDTVDDLLDTVDDLTDPVVDVVSDVVSETVEAAGDIVEDVVDEIVGNIEETLDAVTEPVAALQEAALNTVNNAVDGLIGSTEGVLDPLLSVSDGLTDAVEGNVQDIFETVLDGASGVTTPVNALFGETLNDVGGVIGTAGAATSAITDPVSTLSEGVTDAAGDVINDIAGAGDIASGAAETIGDALGDATAPVGEVVDEVGEVIDDVTAPIEDVVTDVLDAVGDALDDNVGDAVEDVTDGVTDVVEDIASDPVAPVVDSGTDAVDDVTDIVDDILSGGEGGGDPLIEIDTGLSLNGGGDPGGDTAEDGEGTLLDVNIDSLLETDSVDDLDGALDNNTAELSLGGSDTVDLVDEGQEILDEAGVDLEGVGEFEDVDVDELMEPLAQVVTDAQNDLDGMDGGGDLSLQLSDDGDLTGDLTGELIGDIVVDSGGEDLSGGFDGTDLPDPDSVISEGLSLVDDGLSGLGDGGGGLFG